MCTLLMVLPLALGVLAVLWERSWQRLRPAPDLDDPGAWSVRRGGLTLPEYEVVSDARSLAVRCRPGPLRLALAVAFLAGALAAGWPITAPLRGETVQRELAAVLLVAGLVLLAIAARCFWLAGERFELLLEERGDLRGARSHFGFVRDAWEVPRDVAAGADLLVSGADNQVHLLGRRGEAPRLLFAGGAEHWELRNDMLRAAAALRDLARAEP